MKGLMIGMLLIGSLAVQSVSAMAGFQEKKEAKATVQKPTTVPTKTHKKGSTKNKPHHAPLPSHN